MTDRVRIYEEKTRSIPRWAWFIPILLLLGLGVFLFTHPLNKPLSGPSTNQPQLTPLPAADTAAALPDLGTVHFEPDLATVTPNGRATLQRAANALRENPGLRLRIEGYTGTLDPRNQTLPQQRASAVARYLIQQGITSDRLTGSGFTTSAPNTGRTNNRRIELFPQP